MESIRKALGERESFWVTKVPRSMRRTATAIGPEPPDPGWNGGGRLAARSRPAAVETAGIDPLPTDDWPFSLSSRARPSPRLNLRGMVIDGGASLWPSCWSLPRSTARPNGQMFFLGAGFMLLETKGVVHMALLFGSTWVVNSIVFFAILVMILLEQPLRAGRAAADGSGRTMRCWSGPCWSMRVVPMDYFLSLPGVSKGGRLVRGGLRARSSSRG